MSGIVNFAVRGAQILFAAVVTGLSINLAKGHQWGGLPITLGYVSFVGCISLLGAFIGLATTWVELLQGPIGMIVDGFIAILNLAGGVVVAVKLKGVKCEDSNDIGNSLNIVTNSLINGGWKGKGCFYCQYQGDEKILLSRCKQNQADTAFMLLTFIVLLVSLVMTFLRMKKGY